jgi:hypothetical protein
MKYLTTALLLCLSVTVWAQTFSSNIAQLFYDNCSNCHHQGGIAPFSLVNFSEITASAGVIYDAIAQKRMPPWPPNEEYKEFSHSRALNETDKNAILDWLTNGMPEGDPSATPAPPVFSNDALLGEGDLEVQMPTYMSKAAWNSDDYVCFSIPSNLLSNKKIRAMEVVPGNPEIVHHCLVYIDETGTYPTDSTSGVCNGPTNATLVGGYTPGSTPLIFPSGSQLKLGMTMEANSNVVLAMHYPAGSFGQFDSTKVIFHFYDDGETGIREVEAAPVLQNWSFVLPANDITPVNASFNNIPINTSLLSIFPHMHLLGRSIRSYGLNPQNDTIRLIDIPYWDFHWQDFYMFKNLVLIPANSTLHAEGYFDNTSGNFHNPNNPPITVYPGLNTTDEMFLVYMHYLPYQAGDELHNIEEMTTLSLTEYVQSTNMGLTVYPNPFSNSTQIQFNEVLPQQRVSISIYDQQGRLVKSLGQGILLETGEISWDGTSSKGNIVEPGIYYVSALVEGQHVLNGKLVKR